MGMVARYHHVQILEIKDKGYWTDEYESLFTVKLSEQVMYGSFLRDYLMVHAKDELSAWKQARDYLDGKRGNYVGL